MGKILKKGWFVILIITATFALLGFFISWTFCKDPGSKTVIKFKYKEEINIKVSDFEKKENIDKVKALEYSYYTGSSISTYKYVNIKSISATKIDDYYQIKVNDSAFDDTNIKNKESVKKGFLRNLTLIVVEQYVDLSEYPDTTQTKTDKEGNEYTVTIKGVSTLFDTTFYNENSLDEEGNLFVETSNYNRNIRLILYPVVGGVIGLIIGFTLVLILGYKFSDKLERNNEIFDNETVFKTPFHKAYWKEAGKEFKSVKKMAIMALLLGLTLVSKLIVLPSGFGTLGFRFGLIFLSVACMIGGPYFALIIGALSDILGFFLFESGSGAFNPIFTASAMLTCFIYALCFYRTNISFTKALIARIFVNFICNFIIEGFGQIIVYKYKFSWLYLTSLPKQVAYLIPQSIIIFVVLIIVTPIAADTGFVDEKIKKGISLF